MNAVVRCLLSLLVPLCLFSCVNVRKATYFNGQTDAVIPAPQNTPDPVIQKNDLLNIVVSSLNPEASTIFNSPKGYSNNPNRPEEANGYLVRSDGNIQFPILGAVRAEGLTTQALKEEIAKELRDRKLLVDPIVSVRYLNFRITVLGEVAKPSVINVPNERINVLEALGLAGDITVFGKRDNVMLIREENGNKIIRRLNLNSPEFLTSPYYYLRSNDIIYVQPSNGKIASSNRTLQILPIVLSALSFTAIIVTNIND